MASRQIEPLGAIDLGKGLHPSAFRRPFDFEGVASYGLDVDIAFDGERNHPLAATLANFAERCWHFSEVTAVGTMSVHRGKADLTVARIDFPKLTQGGH